jgi:hypothetical protein
MPTRSFIADGAGFIGSHDSIEANLAKATQAASR